jgi:hypothetical protein
MNTGIMWCMDDDNDDEGDDNVLLEENVPDQETQGGASRLTELVAMHKPISEIALEWAHGVGVGYSYFIVLIFI